MPPQPAFNEGAGRIGEESSWLVQQVITYLWSHLQKLKHYQTFFFLKFVCTCVCTHGYSVYTFPHRPREDVRLPTAWVTDGVKHLTWVLRHECWRPGRATSAQKWYFKDHTVNGTCVSRMSFKSLTYLKMNLKRSVLVNSETTRKVEKLRTAK